MSFKRSSLRKQLAYKVGKENLNEYWQRFQKYKYKNDYFNVCVKNQPESQKPIERKEDR